MKKGLDFSKLTKSNAGPSKAVAEKFIKETPDAKKKKFAAMMKKNA